MTDQDDYRRPLWEELAAKGLWARGKDGHDYLIRSVRPSDARLISSRNGAMLHLARRIGFTTRRDPDDLSLVVAEITF